MKKNELTKLFAFLEKYGINFNEYMLAKMSVSYTHLTLPTTSRV